MTTRRCFSSVAMLLLLLMQTSFIHGQDTQAESSSPPPPPTTCFSTEQVKCLLARNCTDLHESLYPHRGGGGAAAPDSDYLLLGRLRFPGTASSAETRLFDAYETPRPKEAANKAHRRYADLALASGCASTSSLCFTPHTANDGSASGAGSSVDLATAFRPLRYSSIFFNHSAYDATRAEFDAELTSTGQNNVVDNGVMITTIRDPGSYAAKWYMSRINWDVVTDLRNATFDEWVDLAPWRMNMFTRVLGARDGDRKTMPVEMLRTKRYVGLMTEEEKAAFVEDVYMKEQNRLGPERSEVYALALERLENDFMHIGVFNRMPEMWELLSYRFCWHMEEPPYQPGQQDKSARGLDAMARITKKDAAAAADIWARLERMNRLDLALVEAADRIMDDKMKEMRSEKANGVLCNFLGKVKVTCDGRGRSGGEL